MVKFASVEMASWSFARFYNLLPMQGLEEVLLKRRGEAKEASVATHQGQLGNSERT